MQSRSNNLYYALILGLTSLRVLLTKPRACPADFDCNSYIAMANSLAYDPRVPGHHAMRVLPSFLAGCLEQLGMSIDLAFRWLSGGAYIAFGLLTFWFLRRFSVKPLIAFSFTLLCLAAHHAIRIPLQLVYQSCDMLVYSWLILMLYCTHKQYSKRLLLLSLLGIFIRQNVFILAVCSLLYCYQQSKQFRILFYILVVIIAYSLLQYYYHATSTFTALLHPPEDFFGVSHLYFVLIDSKLLELFVPLAPFLVLYAKSLSVALWRYWHLTVYMIITVGQPFLGYHLTGNNFARLALQGVIGMYVLAGLVSVKHTWSRAQLSLFVFYALFMFVTWGLPYRLLGMTLFGVAFGWLSLSGRKQFLPEVTAFP